MVTAFLGGGDVAAYLTSGATLVGSLIGAWALIRSTRRTSQRLDGPGADQPSIEELRATVKRQVKTIDELGAAVQRQNDRLKYQDGQIESYSDALKSCEQREKALREELKAKGVL